MAKIGEFVTVFAMDTKPFVDAMKRAEAECRAHVTRTRQQRTYVYWIRPAVTVGATRYQWDGGECVSLDHSPYIPGKDEQ